MSTKRQFSNVPDLLKGMGLNKNIVNKVKNEIDTHSLAKDLIILRTKNNLTQSEFAKKVGVSIKVIKRIESSKNSMLRLKDIYLYVDEFNHPMDIHIGTLKLKR